MPRREPSDASWSRRQPCSIKNPDTIGAVPQKHMRTSRKHMRTSCAHQLSTPAPRVRRCGSSAFDQLFVAVNAGTESIKAMDRQNWFEVGDGPPNRTETSRATDRRSTRATSTRTYAPRTSRTDHADTHARNESRKRAHARTHLRADAAQQHSAQRTHTRHTFHALEHTLPALPTPTRRCFGSRR